MKRELLTHIKGTATCNQTISDESTSTTLRRKPNEGVVNWTIPKEEQVQKVLLGVEGSNNHVYIGANFHPNKKIQLHVLLKEYKDVFSWKYTNLRGISKHIGLHKIALELGTIPTQSQCCHLNPNYVGRVNEDLQQLL